MNWYEFLNVGDYYYIYDLRYNIIKYLKLIKLYDDNIDNSVIFEFINEKNEKCIYLKHTSNIYVFHGNFEPHPWIAYLSNEIILNYYQLYKNGSPRNKLGKHFFGLLDIEIRRSYNINKILNNDR